MSMLNSVEELQGFSIAATDGVLGHVKDVYFDDMEWAIRYFVIDTGGWFTGRQILLSPAAVSERNWGRRSFSVNLTKQQIKNGPSIESDKPVSRQHEEAMYQHFGYPRYWSGPYLWGDAVFPTIFEKHPVEDASRRGSREHLEIDAKKDAHLRSAEEVIGYDIKAIDDSVGHIEDLFFDAQIWRIEVIVVDTRNLLSGRHVMISPNKIARVSWQGKIVEVNVTRDEIENSPEFNSDRPVYLEKGSDLYRRLI